MLVGFLFHSFAKESYVFVSYKSFNNSISSSFVKNWISLGGLNSLVSMLSNSTSTDLLRNPNWLSILSLNSFGFFTNSSKKLIFFNSLFFIRYVSRLSKKREARMISLLVLIIIKSDL